MGIIVAGLVLMAARTQRFSILDTDRIELYWHSSQGYLFVNRNRLGWNLTSAEVFTGFVHELLRSPVPVDRSRQSLTVVWCSKDSVQTQVHEGIRTNPLSRVVNGTLFLDAKRKWVHARLEQTTAQEQQAYDTAFRPIGPEYSNANGWSTGAVWGCHRTRDCLTSRLFLMVNQYSSLC